MFLSSGNNKLTQIPSTCLRILADCSNTVFCNSTILVGIPISFSLFGNAFGAVPSAPIIVSISTLLSNFNFEELQRQLISNDFENQPPDLMERSRTQGETSSQEEEVSNVNFPFGLDDN